MYDGWIVTRNNCYGCKWRQAQKIMWHNLKSFSKGALQRKRNKKKKKLFSLCLYIRNQDISAVIHILLYSDKWIKGKAENRHFLLQCNRDMQKQCRWIHEYEDIPVFVPDPWAVTTWFPCVLLFENQLYLTLLDLCRLLKNKVKLH